MFMPQQQSTPPPPAPPALSQQMKMIQTTEWAINNSQQMHNQPAPPAPFYEYQTR